MDDPAPPGGPAPPLGLRLAHRRPARRAARAPRAADPPRRADRPRRGSAGAARRRRRGARRRHARRRHADDWRDAATIARLQLPLRELDPRLTSADDEYDEAKRRLLPGEALDRGELEHLTGILRKVVAAAGPPRPIDLTLLLRDDPELRHDELVALDPLRAVIAHPRWRRVLGFAYFDADPALVPGQVYQYRVSGGWPEADLTDRVVGFHTAPATTQLPAELSLGDVRVRFSQPRLVELADPRPSDPIALTRRGVALSPGRDPAWLTPGTGGWSAVIDLPVAVTSLVLELGHAAHSLTYAAGAPWLPQGPEASVPAGDRPALSFATPVHQIRLGGEGFLCALRFPAKSSTAIVERAVVLPPLVLADTPRPAAPLALCVGTPFSRCRRRTPARCDASEEASGRPPSRSSCTSGTVTGVAPPAEHGALKTYWLLGPDGHRYESTTPGTLGGNARAKIYGRLDCGSALAAIRDHGEAYTQHRVFFADEEAAVAAGYRPCGNCMRDRFVAWRESRARESPAASDVSWCNEPRVDRPVESTAAADAGREIVKDLGLGEKTGVWQLPSRDGEALRLLFDPPGTIADSLKSDLRDALSDAFDGLDVTLAVAEPITGIKARPAAFVASFSIPKASSVSLDAFDLLGISRREDSYTTLVARAFAHDAGFRAALLPALGVPATAAAGADWMCRLRVGVTPGED
ncbi:MAG TPA: hypothetical protein VL242_22590, partial [Sorangium sp.]|nr:hypothetical protein [Sorangium sp.]